MNRALLSIPNLFLDGPYVTVAQCFHHVGSRFAELTIRGIEGLREECRGPLIFLLPECFSTHDKIKILVTTGTAEGVPRSGKKDLVLLARLGDWEAILWISKSTQTEETKAGRKR